VKRARREYKPQAASGLYSRRAGFIVRGYAAPPDAVSAIGTRAIPIRPADLNL
jgi:hypothetical protein